MVSVTRVGSTTTFPPALSTAPAAVRTSSTMKLTRQPGSPCASSAGSKEPMSRPS